jgi:hypothetical protein
MLYLTLFTRGGGLSREMTKTKTTTKTKNTTKKTTATTETTENGAEMEVSGGVRGAVFVFGAH